MPTLLIVSPTEQDYLALAARLVEANDTWRPSRVASVDDAIPVVVAGGCDACLVDARSDGRLSAGDLERLAAIRPPVAVVVMVPAGDRDTARAARGAGAADAVAADSDDLLLDRILQGAMLGTEREKLRTEVAELRRARRRAEAAARLREELLSVAAHDLRNPLDAMLGWIQLLRSGHLEPADAQRALDTVERSARSQASVISELQELARTVSGAIDLDRGDVDVAARARAAVDQAGDSAARKQLQISVTAPASAVVRADLRRVDQVLQILLRQAINNTPRQGEIRVSVLAAPDRVTLAVSDEGSGLSAEVAPFVFDPLGPDGGPLRKLGRPGLELIALRCIVEAHGGTVAASSAGQGRGTTLKIELPRST